MAKREPVIKYYDNKESHGMIIDWSKVWREYNGKKLEKYVVWPYSKSKGWVDRIEQQI